MADVQATQQDSQKHAPDCLMTLFGATGDLTKRLLLPSIYNLASKQKLAANFKLLGVAMEDWSDDTMRSHVADTLKEFWGPDVDATVVKWLTDRTYYQQGNFDQDASFDTLKQRIETLQGHGNRLFYLAIAPSFIATVAGQLARVGLFTEADGCWRRLIIEKPFGHDLASAVALNADLQKCLREDQIYRIDHFAGKDAVQDLAVFRFSNAIIEPLWDRTMVDSVQITVAETVGVEKRAAYYEKSGALRDMVPNHLAELLSLVAMEPPVSFSAEYLRDKQVELLASVRKIKSEEVKDIAVRGQYVAGTIDGQAVPAYCSEPGVDPNSVTETYVAMKVEIDNWRWAGVPFFLRTGKRMTSALTEIAVQFRQPPARLFPNAKKSDRSPNTLVFNLKPTEDIKLTFGARAPGLETMVVGGSMDYRFPQGPFGDHAKGYERLLHDAMLGNTILFQRAAFVEQGWKLVQPLLDAWGNSGGDGLATYAAGSAGPKEADELLAKTGHEWRCVKADSKQ